jgi:hypothetical protein
MEIIHCRIPHPQPPKGGNRSLHRLFIIYSEKCPLGDLGVKDKCNIISLFILMYQ